MGRRPLQKYLSTLGLNTISNPGLTPLRSLPVNPVNCHAINNTVQYSTHLFLYGKDSSYRLVNSFSLPSCQSFLTVSLLSYYGNIITPSWVTSSQSLPCCGQRNHVDVILVLPRCCLIISLSAFHHNSTISHGWRRSLRRVETIDTKIRSKHQTSNPCPAPASCTPCMSSLIMIRVGPEDTFPTFYFPSSFLPVYHIYIIRTMIIMMGVLNETHNPKQSCHPDKVVGDTICRF